MTPRANRVRRAVAGILALRRSMFVQIGLLTVTFLAWGVYAFVVQPILDSYPTDPVPPLEATASEFRDAVHIFMSEVQNDPRTAADIAAKPIVRQVEASNPDFRYYIRVGDHTFGNAPSRFYRALRLDRIERTHRDVAGIGLCSQAIHAFEGGPPGSYADFYMCDRVVYFEYRGLLHPVAMRRAPYQSLYERWLNAFGRTFLIPAGGVFLIFTLIMGANMLMIRRVGSMASSLDPRHLDRQLPEKGLASEILPLVRGVNKMIAHIDAYQRRNAFFLSAAAHEMRTPLTVLRTRLEMLDDHPLRDKLTGDVRRLVDLVNQLLALMSIGDRRQVAGFVDLVACCRDAVAEFAAAAAELDISILLDCAVAEHEIPGDAALVRSAIGNMIRNALSFSPPGGSVRVRLEAGGRVSVRDDGPGISHADPAALFEPFVRASPGRSGYGLGLAIVKAVATLHGGEVEAGNAAGGGALFAIVFPAAT